MNICAACGATLSVAARFCPTCAAPVEAKPDERERKLATVVFADLVGSTELGGSQDPERTRALLDRFYDAMAGEIETAGGTIEKFAGDAVMAVFGAPAALEDHAERALHAAVAMRRRLRELFGEALAMRIGVNTGEVVVGKPREGSSFVTGDPVNVAARLEQAAEPGEVLVGERTVATARGAFEFAEPQTIGAKGKPEGVGCRRLVRPLSLMRPRGVGGLRRAFVGRDDEVRVLERVYAEVEDRRQAQLVTILGDAGVGKTRLLREFWDRLGGRSPEPLRRTGRCLSYGRGITYWPLGEVLKEHLGILDGDPPAVTLERLGSREILGLTLGLDVGHGLHPLAARDRFQDAWVEFLEEMVAERPTVMLIEDVHWAEEQLLDLLERLLRDTRGPLLLVATARPELLEQRPGWGARVRGTTVALEALSPEDAVRMVDELLGGTLPPGLGEVVVQGAEGNPFFVEELLATLIDRQLLERQNGSWQLAELPSDFAVPDTVQAVVAARVDLLDPAEKQALQAASVIGRIFWAGPVYELVHECEPDLQVLEERDFIRRRAGSSIAGDREYAIKHALTREVAYAGLPRARRARLHAAFARWLERTGEGRDEYAPLLAHHYAEAVRPDDVDLAWAGEEGELAELRARALSSLRRAAELAIGRFEIDDGRALLYRALDLEPDEAERVALWREVGRANALKYDGEPFWAAMQNAIDLCSDERTLAELYSELAFHTAARSGMWQRTPDRALVHGWAERALALAAGQTAARARALLARCYWEYEDSADRAEEASVIAERLGDVELLSYAWEALAAGAFGGNRYEVARERLKRCLDVAYAISDPDHLADIYAAAVPLYIALGRFDDARRLASLHDDVVARLSPHHHVHGVAVWLNLAELQGDWKPIAELTDRTRHAVEANLATPCIWNPRSLFVCALAHAHLGNEDAAARLEADAEELAGQGFGMALDAPRIRLALHRGELERARKLLGVVPGIVSKTWYFLSSIATRIDALAALADRERVEEEAPVLLRPDTYLEPFALRALALVRADGALAERAIARFEALGLGWHAAETRKIPWTGDSRA
jgi:class 3 adenylate cyclase